MYKETHIINKCKLNNYLCTFFYKTDYTLDLSIYDTDTYRAV